jgi:hypothetical protein
MRKWHDEQWDIPFIYDYAIKCHVSYMNNKSAPIPEEARPEVERFLRRIGYRLVLRRLEHPATIAAGQVLPLTMEWENVGCAPPYRDYLLAARLQPAAGGEPVVLVTDTSAKGCLPGGHGMAVSVPLAQTTPAGECELSLALVDPVTHEPAIRLAIEGRAEDGWYPLSRLDIEQ